ncbi:hypothetical protein [Tenacibaculum agarivorans]|uniref:hypothetical protein n=1 Tax=Tenacibaculum agarivorans TaxID=1908389 RepID=UPI00094B81B1|nr:hypothetical protein [Tenacibaculum agarivorans]
MKKNYLFFTLSLLSIFSLSSQTKEQEYSKKQIQSYNKVYQKILDNPFDITASMRKNIKQVSITEERMGEILQAQFNGTKISITKKEAQELEKLKSLMENDKNIHEIKIKKIMTENHLDYENYQKIKKKITTNKTLKARINKSQIK